MGEVQYFVNFHDSSVNDEFEEMLSSINDEFEEMLGGLHGLHGTLLQSFLSVSSPAQVDVAVLP